MECQTEGIYLVKIKDIISNINIYKIGRSHNIINRIKKYSKGSSTIVLLECCNSVQCEKDLISLFKVKFKQNKHYGLEYFEGDKYDMMDVICKEVKKYNDVEKEKIDAIQQIKDIKEIKENNEIAKLKMDTQKKDEEHLSNDDNICLLDKNNDIGEIDDNINYKSLNNRTCPKCNTEFKYTSILKKHMLTTVRCKSSLTYIDNHINNCKNIEIKTNENIFCCIDCNDIFTRKSSLLRHYNNSKCSKLKYVKTKLKNKGIGTLTIDELKLIQPDKASLIL